MPDERAPVLREDHFRALSEVDAGRDAWLGIYFMTCLLDELWGWGFVNRVYAEPELEGVRIYELTDKGREALDG